MEGVERLYFFGMSLIMKMISKLLILLSVNERKKATLLLAMIIVMALLDTLGVVSIMPFMAVLANPTLIQTNTVLSGVYLHLGFTDSRYFLFALGLFVFILLVVSLSFKALCTYAQLRFILMAEYSIGKRLVEGYLHQPYSWFLSRHSADLGGTILSEVNRVINSVIYPMMLLIAQSAVALAILILLIFVDPKLASIVFITLTISYALVFQVTRRFLSRIGKESIEANRSRFTAVAEAFGAFKALKVMGLEEVYIQRFSDPARTFAQHQASEQIVRQIPRFALEAIAFGGLMIVVLYLLAESGSFASALPIIVLYAFAGYRMMPALQQIYSSVTQLRFASPALDVLHNDLMTIQPPNSYFAKDTLNLKHEITLDNIVYSYPNSTHPTLNGISLTIPAFSTVGFVGATGSGKTTLVDLILGLLEAQHGLIQVDGHSINEHNRRTWQQVIGYVPQNIYLADDTVAANIAFGVDVKDIDKKAIESAAKIANLHDFVTQELPKQYQTIVGEQGVRLSGGQRQRIGIARALYHKPQVLIMDEATSALDNLTEQAVMEAVQNLDHKITIILIAHRLSTVRDCDRIFLLDKGELKAQGIFDELVHINDHFRAMATSCSEIKNTNN